MLRCQLLHEWNWDAVAQNAPYYPCAMHTMLSPAASAFTHLVLLSLCGLMSGLLISKPLPSAFSSTNAPTAVTRMNARPSERSSRANCSAAAGAEPRGDNSSIGQAVTGACHALTACAEVFLTRHHGQLGQHSCCTLLTINCVVSAAVQLLFVTCCWICKHHLEPNRTSVKHERRSEVALARGGGRQDCSCCCCSISANCCPWGWLWLTHNSEL